MKIFTHPYLKISKDGDYMQGYILAHDLGTTGNKATLFREDGTLLSSAVYEYDTYYPYDKWVEQNPDDWWRAVCDSTKILLEQTGVNAKDILCVSFSAQMMGCLLIDNQGNPLRDSIIWADSRASAQEKRMIEAIGLKQGYEITGHRLSASYSAAKLLWVKDNEPEIYKKADKMIQAKDYIILKLTGRIVTDYSDASGTNLLVLHTKKWSDTLIDAFEIDRNLLPEIVPSTEIAGKVTSEAAHICGLMEGTPVVVGGGDGCCACAGAGVVEEGNAYNAIGTSSWISYAAHEPLFDPEMRIFNWVHLDSNLITPMGTMQAAGLSYNWYKNQLCEHEQVLAEKKHTGVYKLLDEQALSSTPGANGLMFLPYLVGERSPLWNLNARGCFIGLSASTQKKDMTRAVLEGVAFNLKTILGILEMGRPLNDIIMIGGGAKGRAWLEIMATIWQKQLVVPRYIEEATSMGAAICGGVGIGLYKDFASCKNFNPIETVIEPNTQFFGKYERLYPIFKRSYEQLIPVFDDLSEYSAANI